MCAESVLLDYRYCMFKSLLLFGFRPGKNVDEIIDKENNKICRFLVGEIRSYWNDSSNIYWMARAENTFEPRRFFLHLFHSAWKADNRHSNKSIYSPILRQTPQHWTWPAFSILLWKCATVWCFFRVGIACLCLLLHCSFPDLFNVTQKR
jgi:hypothetical protein